MSEKKKKPTNAGTEKKLFILQEKMFATTDDLIRSKVLSEMYVELVSSAKSILKKSFTVAIQENNNIDTYSHEAASLFIEAYLSNPNFRVDKTFLGYLALKVLEVIYHTKNLPCGMIQKQGLDEDGNNVKTTIYAKSFDKVMTTYGTGDGGGGSGSTFEEMSLAEMGDLLEDDNIRKHENYEYLNKELITILQFEDKCYIDMGSKEMAASLVAFLHFLTKKDRSVANFFKHIPEAQPAKVFYTKLIRQVQDCIKE